MFRRIVLYYWKFRYQWLRRKWNRSAKRSVLNGIALMFHHVTDDYVDINESCKCKVVRFEEILKQYIYQKRRFVSVDKMLDFIKSKNSTPFVVVTFDDVPDNFYSNAYPILKRYRIPFVLFITTGYIGQPGYLSESQIKELDKEELCTIGAHTVSHPMLRQLHDCSSELVDSKIILEQLLGHRVDFMAYPYGRQSSVSQTVMLKAKEAGYLCSFGTIQAPITDLSSNNLFYIPRIVEK